jgi:acetate kinase
VAGIRSGAHRVLVVNAGSSSLKLSLLSDDADEPLLVRELDAPHGFDQTELSAALACGLSAADLTAHRVVHGGARFRAAVRVDADVREALQDLVALAPLHQPQSLAAMDAIMEAIPGVPAVACFDTAFHATLPPAAREYALPLDWRERWGLRRYGFHGLSHAYIARRVPELLGVDGGELRLVSCHLGSGASLCAIAGGRSIETTMGFTPLEGLVMGTRSGSIDPGLLLWLLERGELSVSEVSRGLEHSSGLLGLAGSADMREVLARRAAGDERAAVALEVYLHRLRAGIAAMAAALGGIDALAFTGGVGEHAAPIREETVAGLAFLGDFQVLTIPAREDLEIARQARELVGAR